MMVQRGEEEEEEEFQEAEILWPDSDSGHAKSSQVQRRRSAKRRKSSAPIELPTVVEAGVISYTWTQQGFKSNNLEKNGLDDWKWTPPHVILALKEKEKAAYSLCTGNGRTLKGRDLRQVRDAVLRLTGFLER